MKSQALLTVALFLVSAPAPDSRDIAEFTSNFIVPETPLALSADETVTTDVSGQTEQRLPEPRAEATPDQPKDDQLKNTTDNTRDEQS
jgi:hypothetical protein